MNKFIIWVVIILLIVGGGIFWYTHRSVEQVKTADDLELLDSLRDLQETPIDSTQSDEIFQNNEVIDDAEGTRSLEEGEAPNNSSPGADVIDARTSGSQSQTQSQSQPQRPQPTRQATPDVSVLKQGTFDPDAEDSDSVHRGWGGVKIVNFRGKNKVVFGEDFRVTRGPDYKLYLVGEMNVETSEQFRSIKSGSYNIAEIKQFSGEQTFDIPDNIDIDDIQGVVIWCEAFSQYISYANVE